LARGIIDPEKLPPGSSLHYCQFKALVLLGTSDTGNVVLQARLLSDLEQLAIPSHALLDPLTFPTSLLAILKGLAMTIQQAEIAKNIDEIQSNAVELHKRFTVFVDKFNDIGRDITRLNKSFNAAVGSAQSRLLPQGRRFAELAGQNGEIDVSDQIDEVVREIQGE